MNFTHSHIHSNRITDPNGMSGAMKIRHQIHCLEMHAYNSLLKAFMAQSEHLTWGKEGLLTQIRKELHIENFEHGKILMKIHSDETIKRIREQRKMESHTQAYNNANTTGHSSTSSGNSVIRFKAPPSAAFYPRTNTLHSQDSLEYNDNPSTAQFVHGNSEPPKEMFNYDVPLLPTGSGSVPKGNYHNKQPFYSSESPVLNNKSDFIPPSGSGSGPKGNDHNKQPFYSSESPMINNESDFILPSGRGSMLKVNYHNKQPFYSFESLVLNNKSDFIPPSGRGSVSKRNYHNKQPFYSYESLVLNNESDFIPPSARGSVSNGNYHNKRSFYSPESPMLNNESDFIPPSGRGSVPKGNYNNKCPFNSPESPMLNNESNFIPPSGRGSLPKENYHNKLPFYTSESPVLNNKSDFIRLRRTDMIINEVENMLFTGENPEPVAIERAKKTLHEQERDLLEAIGKLENVLEDEDDDDDEAPQNVQDYSGGTTDDWLF